MTKYTYPDGTPYEGPTITTPDGRVLSGATYNRDSKKLIPVVEEVAVVEDTLPSDVEPSEAPAPKKKAKAKKK
tara:strand:- start:10555 stop:10773 length:219 start_codon:yes stop_codon:yes gene_type:complete